MIFDLTLKTFSKLNEYTKDFELSSEKQIHSDRRGNNIKAYKHEYRAVKLTTDSSNNTTSGSLLLIYNFLIPNLKIKWEDCIWNKLELRRLNVTKLYISTNGQLVLVNLFKIQKNELAILIVIILYFWVQYTCYLCKRGECSRKQKKYRRQLEPRKTL